MLARIWGCRGSMASPGPRTVRYGGNTSCVEVLGEDGTVLVLDAGTGIRELGSKLVRDGVRKVHLLLTHLHMDHIEGLGFFAPLWRRDVEVSVWGPPSPTMSLVERLGRYLSPPLFPMQLSQIPSQAMFSDVSEEPWTLGGLEVSAAPVEHPGPTLGYRITEQGRSFAYMPDHEPARVTKIETAAPEWLSGSEVALGADVLLHDAQFTPDEYPERVAWGHSSYEDTVAFARVCKAEHLVLFHHDPSHSDDDLEAIGRGAGDLWGREDGVPPQLAREGMEIVLDGDSVRFE